MGARCAPAVHLEAAQILCAQVTRLARQNPRAWILTDEIGQMLGAQVMRLDCCGQIVGFDTTRAARALGGCFATTRAGCALGALAPPRLVHVLSLVDLHVYKACHIYTYTYICVYIGVYAFASALKHLATR